MVGGREGGWKGGWEGAAEPRHELSPFFCGP